MLFLRHLVPSNYMAAVRIMLGTVVPLPKQQIKDYLLAANMANYMNKNFVKSISAVLNEQFF